MEESSMKANREMMQSLLRDEYDKEVIHKLNRRAFNSKLNRFTTVTQGEKNRQRQSQTVLQVKDIIAPPAIQTERKKFKVLNQLQQKQSIFPNLQRERFEPHLKYKLFKKKHCINHPKFKSSSDVLLHSSCKSSQEKENFELKQGISDILFYGKNDISSNQNHRGVLKESHNNCDYIAKVGKRKRYRYENAQKAKELEEREDMKLMKRKNEFKALSMYREDTYKRLKANVFIMGALNELLSTQQKLIRGGLTFDKKVSD